MRGRRLVNGPPRCRGTKLVISGLSSALQDFKSDRVMDNQIPILEANPTENWLSKLCCSPTRWRPSGCKKSQKVPARSMVADCLDVYTVYDTYTFWPQFCL